MSQERYPIVIERTLTGLSAETRRSFREAVAAHVEVMREIVDLIPEPSSSVDYVEVAA